MREKLSIGAISRRHFLCSTASALTISGLAVGAAPGSQAKGAPKLKIGFLGAAHSHALDKYKIVRASPGFELVGLVPESDAVRQRFEALKPNFVSRAALFEQAEVIVVESAVQAHAKDATAALRAGKHVHVEKPPTTTMREMEEIVALAREKKRLFQVGYMWRHNPGFHQAMQAARAGWLGEVYLVRATMNTFVEASQRPDWAPFKGGAMFEQGCHLIDAVVRLLGKPQRVTPHLQSRAGDGFADNCIAVLEYAKTQAIITNSVNQPNAGPHRFLEILGTNGVARVQPIEPPGLVVDLAKAAGPYRAGVQKIEMPAYRRYEEEFVELAQAVRDGTPLSVSLADELATQETVLRACAML